MHYLRYSGFTKGEWSQTVAQYPTLDITGEVFGIVVLAILNNIRSS